MTKLYQEPSAEAQKQFDAHCEHLERRKLFQSIAGLRTGYANTFFNLKFEMPERQNDRFFDNWFKSWLLRNHGREAGLMVTLIFFSFGGVFLGYTKQTQELPNFNVMFALISLGFLLFGLLCVVSLINAVYWVDLSPTRYNRQAQLVHMYVRPKWYKKPVLVTVPWKSVRAFAEDDLKNRFYLGRLHLVYPGQESVLGHAKPIVMYRSELCGLHTLSGDDCLCSYEMIRRYMEMGIDAIQEYDVPESLITRVESDFKEWDFFQPFRDIFYLGSPRLIEKIMAKRSANFRWPEEVEALCAPDAREKGLLDEYDTEPVRATEYISCDMRWRGKEVARDRLIDQLQGIAPPTKK